MITTYTTVQGDMWDKISYKVYGSCSHIDVLIENNPEYREVQFFSAGIELEIPPIDDTTSASTLPPWKQVEE